MRGLTWIENRFVDTGAIILEGREVVAGGRSTEVQISKNCQSIVALGSELSQQE